jgi:integrase
VQRVEHHPALPYRDLPTFIARLRGMGGITARALEFTILTAARSGEALGASFDEIDLEAKLWTVPAERMKGGRPHRVPLSPRVLAIVKGLAAIRLNDFVFPSIKRDKPLHSATMLMLLRDLHPGITTHGFRSTFKGLGGRDDGLPGFLV